MIISKTPLRMSFAGGGSDLASYYQKFGGAVVSTTIDKYVYIAVNKKFDEGVRVSYSKTEEVLSSNLVEHHLVKECLRMMDIPGGIEITSIADIPSKGSGLGSSSAFTVGLLNALNAFKGKYVSAGKLGFDSCRIEIDICGEPIGKQDQYASAFGGFNFIKFNQDDTVDVDPIIITKDMHENIEKNIIMFYTGITRSASAILAKQTQIMNTDVDKQQVMHEMVKLAYDLRDELHRGNLDSFGEILHQNWILKKRISDNISTSAIDDYYQIGIDNGAVGGKILGAGAGGFLMFYAPSDTHDRITHKLSSLKRVDVKFENSGSKIIFYNL